MKIKFLIGCVLFIQVNSWSQSVKKTMIRLPDTDQKSSYTNTFGEDNDYQINMPFYKNNGDGTISDTITTLMWQQKDGGEMTIESAFNYCDTLTLGGYTDWRLPSAMESFSILNHQLANPAINIVYFTTSNAEYWWTSEHQSNDATKIWCTNAGGGIGNHPKLETISAGGTKKFHVRAVRDVATPTVIPNRFVDNGDSTITDNYTNLVWQKFPNTNALTWEQALINSENLVLAGQSDWRLPNIKELQSLTDVGVVSPALTSPFFQNLGIKKYWSSTTLPNQTGKAWYLSTQFGITTYDDKTVADFCISVRSGPKKVDSVKSNIAAFTSDSKTFYLNKNGDLIIPFDHNDANSKVILSIFDLSGKLIYKNVFNDCKRDIVLNGIQFSNDLYLIQLIKNNCITQGKIIVNRD